MKEQIIAILMKHSMNTDASFDMGYISDEIIALFKAEMPTEEEIIEGSKQRTGPQSIWFMRGAMWAVEFSRKRMGGGDK